MTGPDTVLAFAHIGDLHITEADQPIDDGGWSPMDRVGDGPDWRAASAMGDSRLIDLTVRAFTQGGRPGVHVIRVARPGSEPVRRAPSESDAAAIGLWPENGILGTQLGPNRNGRIW